MSSDLGRAPASSGPRSCRAGCVRSAWWCVVCRLARICWPVSGSQSASRATPWRRNTRVTVRAGTPSSSAIQSGPRREDRRSARIRICTVAGVRRGLRYGREDRSCRASQPPVSKRFTHRCAHCRDTQAPWPHEPPGAHRRAPVAPAAHGMHRQTRTTSARRGFRGNLAVDFGRQHCARARKGPVR
jgi:hypothetical protein